MNYIHRTYAAHHDIVFDKFLVNNTVLMPLDYFVKPFFKTFFFKNKPQKYNYDSGRLLKVSINNVHKYRINPYTKDETKVKKR